MSSGSKPRRSTRPSASRTAMRIGPPLRSPAARPQRTPRTRSRISPMLTIPPPPTEERRPDKDSRAALQQVDVRPLDQMALGDAQPIHQTPGDGDPLGLGLAG